MGSTDEVYFVVSIELLHNVSSKEIPRSSWTDTPTCDLIRVAPHEVAHGSIMRNLLLSIQVSNVIQSIDRWREASMDAENLIINDSCKSEIVKYVCTVSPYIHTPILSEALIIEAVHLSNLSALVIPSDQSHSLRIPYFESEQKKESLNRVKSSVHEVTHEQIIRHRALASYFEELQ
jgi:hypothetical protein